MGFRGTHFKKTERKENEEAAWCRDFSWQVNDHLLDAPLGFVSKTVVTPSDQQTAESSLC